MYCPQCGSPGQTQNFCTDCGARLQPSQNDGPNHQQQAPKNEVNVTVNVGAPHVIQPPQPSGVAKLAKAVIQARRDAALREEQLAALRRTAQQRLVQCEEVITEIEATIQLDLLPNSSSIRGRYVRALESRRVAANRLKQPLGLEDMLQINHRLTWALDELRLTQRAMGSAELPG